MVSLWTPLCLFVNLSVVRLSIFRSLKITLVNINGVLSKLVFVLILLRSGLGLLMCKFCHF